MQVFVGLNVINIRRCQRTVHEQNECAKFLQVIWNQFGCSSLNKIEDRFEWEI